MPFSIKIIKKGTTYDISDFARIESEIPYQVRNSDYSLVTDYVNINVSSELITKFDSGNQCLIYSGTVASPEESLLFNGEINKKEFNHQEFYWNYQLQNTVFEKMKRIFFDYHQMQDLVFQYRTEIIPYPTLNSTSTYYSNGAIFWWIKVNDLITALFKKVNCDLDWSTYYSVQNIKNITYQDFSDGSYKIGNLSQDKIYLWEPQIWCINQDDIYTRYEVDSVNESNKKKISLFELLTELTSMMGYAYYPKSTTELYVSNTLTPPTPSPETEEYLLMTTEDPKELGVKVEVLSAKYRFLPFYPYDDIRHLYYVTNNLNNQDLTDTYESEFGNGNYLKSIDWYNHLIPYYIDSGDFTIYKNGIPTNYNEEFVHLLLPSVDWGERSILRNKFLMYMGTTSKIEAENVLNIEKKLMIKENYITISDERSPYSRIIFEQLYDW